MLIFVMRYQPYARSSDNIGRVNNERVVISLLVLSTISYYWISYTKFLYPDSDPRYVEWNVGIFMILIASLNIIFHIV